VRRKRKRRVAKKEGQQLDKYFTGNFLEEEVKLQISKMADVYSPVNKF
jgi:transcription elongation factor Elf1